MFIIFPWDSIYCYSHLPFEIFVLRLVRILQNIFAYSNILFVIVSYVNLSTNEQQKIDAHACTKKKKKSAKRNARMYTRAFRSSFLFHSNSYRLNIYYIANDDLVKTMCTNIYSFYERGSETQWKWKWKKKRLHLRCLFSHVLSSVNITWHFLSIPVIYIFFFFTCNFSHIF